MAKNTTERTGSLGFESKLWEAADLLRNNMDPAEYKHVVLGLLFLKYIEDAFEERREELRAAVSDPESEYFTEEDERDEATDRASDEAAEATTTAAARPAAAAVSGAARASAAGGGASTPGRTAEAVGLVEANVEPAGGPFRLLPGRFPGGLVDLSGHTRAAP